MVAKRLGAPHFRWSDWRMAHIFFGAGWTDDTSAGIGAQYGGG